MPNKKYQKGLQFRMYSPNTRFWKNRIFLCVVLSRGLFLFINLFIWFVFQGVFQHLKHSFGDLRYIGTENRALSRSDLRLGKIGAAKKVTYEATAFNSWNFCVA